MHLKIMITISLVALCLALFLPANVQYKVLLQFLVCASAALMLFSAYYLVRKTKPRTAMVSIAEKSESRTL